MFENRFEISIYVIMIVLYFVYVAFENTVTFQRNNNRSIFFILFVVSPIIFYVGIKGVIENIVPFLNQTSSPFSLAMFIASSILLIGIYFLFVKYPYDIVAHVLTHLRHIFSYKTIRSSWVLLDGLKVKRKLILVLLVAFNLLALYGIVQFIYRTYLLSVIETKLSYALIAIGMTIIAIHIFKITHQDRLSDLEEVSHKDYESVDQAIQKISIASGVKEVNYKIIKHTAPTAFTLITPDAHPTIYLTTSLLNIGDAQELEAVIAYEVAQLQSGFIKNVQIVSFLLSLLQLQCVIAFILFISSISFFFGPFLIVFLSIYGLSSLIDTPVPLSLNKNNSMVWLRFFNPPYTFVELIAAFIYYSISYNEVFYADIQSINITRNPSPLYSILTKLRDFNRDYAPLPEKWIPYYFTGENTYIPYTILPQPSVDERLQVLRSVDSQLETMNVRNNETLECPRCKLPLLQHKRMDGEMNTEFDYCTQCQGIWFDRMELASMAELPLPLREQPPNLIYTDGSILHCPRCGNTLNTFIDPTLPKSVVLQRCDICSGYWMDFTSINEYIKYKKAKKKIIF
ncbi:MAG: zf-TFIIB domain-containing protein [bacterium]|nr:zf-TFIIB domain-containing protein [bacterium]